MAQPWRLGASLNMGIRRRKTVQQDKIMSVLTPYKPVAGSYSGFFIPSLPPSFFLHFFSPSFISWLEHSSSIVCRAEINSLIISSPLCFIILHVPPELDAYSCKIISTESHRRDKQVLQLPLRDSSLKPLLEDSAFLLFTGAATPPLKCLGPHAECGCLPGSGW